MKKSFSVLFLFFLLIFCLTSRTSRQEIPVLTQENQEKAYENMLGSAVCIRGSSYCGSGSIFEIKKDEIIIVTNRHVAEYFDEKSYVTFFYGGECVGSVIGCSDTADIGFISVDPDGLKKQEKKQLREIGKNRKAYENLNKNSCFFIVDITGDISNPEIYRGAVVEKEKFLPDYGTEMLYGDGTAVPGMSGSGIFDYYGNYIGTLSGATDRYEIAGVPLTTVLAEYEKIKNPGSHDGMSRDFHSFIYIMLQIKPSCLQPELNGKLFWKLCSCDKRPLW